jgi:uncharacterized membrane protein YeiH
MTQNAEAFAFVIITVLCVAFTFLTQSSILTALELYVMTINDGSVLGLPLWDTIVAIGSALQTRREAGSGFSLAKLVACVVGGLGGGTIACALVGLPPTWMRSPILLPLYAGVGFVVLLVPPLRSLYKPSLGSFATDVLASLWAVLDDTTFMCAVVWGAGLPASSPSLPSPPPAVSVAVAGFVASSGGGIVCDCLSLRLPTGWALRTPSVLTSPSPYHALAPVLAVLSQTMLLHGVPLARVRLAIAAAVVVVTRVVVASGRTMGGLKEARRAVKTM